MYIPKEIKWELVRSSMKHDWKKSIIGIISRGTVTVLSSGQFFLCSSHIILGTGEEVDDASGMGMDNIDVICDGASDRRAARV